jgi:hypothetical protein
LRPFSKRPNPGAGGWAVLAKNIFTIYNPILNPALADGIIPHENMPKVLPTKSPSPVSERGFLL